MSHRGFESMSPETLKEISRKGGEKISQDRAHMAAIGRRGGQVCAAIPGRMAEMGRKGREAVQARKVGA